MIGFLNIYKPRGMSSAQVVGKVKRITGQKVGHLGTLDPLAEGVLPVAIGKATRLFDYFLNKDKVYVATAKFGEETDTLDLGGQVIAKTEKVPTKAEILQILSQFGGKIMQMPPQYSAKNVNGKKAYDLARMGIDFVLTAKQVEIFDLKLLSFDNGEAKFEIHCSAGTYVRSLIRDIANAVGSLATTTSILRFRSGCFDLSSALKIEELDQNYAQKLIIVEKALAGVPCVLLTEQQQRALICGLEANRTDLQEKTTYLFKTQQGKVFGLGQVVGGVIKINSYLFEE